MERIPRATGHTGLWVGLLQAGGALANTNNFKMQGCRAGHTGWQRKSIVVCALTQGLSPTGAQRSVTKRANCPIYAEKELKPDVLG